MVLTVLLFISIALSNIVVFNFFGDFFSYGFWGFLFWASLSLLIASYWVLLPTALRQLRKHRWTP